MELKEKQTSLVGKAYESIKEQILELDLMPGQIISDFTLHKEMGMSRTPIKQALMQLKSDGLIVERDGRGYEIRRITEEDVIDLFDAREGIERTALKIAMERGISQETLSELMCLNTSLSNADSQGDYRKVFDIDSEIHVKLIEAAKNVRLIEYYEMIILQLRRMRLLTYFEKTLPEQAATAHLQLLRAIIENDFNTALEILSSHILRTKEHYVSIIRTRIATDDDFRVLKYLMNNNLSVE